MSIESSRRKADFPGVLILPGMITSAAAATKAADVVYISGDNNLEDYVVKDLEEEFGLAGSNARRPDRRAS